MIRRRLFSLASFLSLLLLAVTMALWLVSCSVWPGRLVTTVSRDASGRIYDQRDSLVVIRNGVVLWRTSEAGVDPPWPPLTVKTARIFGPLPATTSLEDTFLGFSLSNYDWVSAAHYRRSQFSVPLWFIVLCLLGFWYHATSPVPADPNVCRNCAYNLTGNTSGVCPECGTAIKGKVKIMA